MARVSTPDGGARRSRDAPTPGSQSQGTVEESVTTEAILARLSRARNIEDQLDAIAAAQKSSRKSGGGSSSRPSPPGLDQKSQALRLKLCEVLSDVILNDAPLAHSHDAIGRLWKGCFYGRINDIRGRVTKERARAKKRAAGGGGGGGDADGSAAEASKRAASELERQLKQFLKEAIQLYKYIVERYLKDLLPASQSQRSAGSDDDEDERRRTRATIASLYRLHIHLGDLHRYSGQHKQAEECYLAAAAVAPGTGNPFNQLAVVAQQGRDDAPVVALYYYARSLMAAREPFETSRPNLARLLESNKKWLVDHARDGDGGDAKGRGLVDAGNNNNQNKKAAQEWRQRERAAATRRALARLVDLQRALLRGVALDDAARADGRVDLAGIRSEKASLRDALAGLIGGAALGEGLLRRVVAVLAFTTLGAGGEGRLTDDAAGGVAAANQAIAFGFLLRVLALLAGDVDAVLAKMAKKDAGKLGAVRSLSPLLLGISFAASLYGGDCPWFHGLPFFPSPGEDESDGRMAGNAVHEMCKASHAEFWTSLAGAANRIDALPAWRGASPLTGGGIADVKEYDEYRGYVPFAAFLDGADGGKPSKYATVEEVLRALSEGKREGGARGAEAEIRAKLRLVLSVVDDNTCSEGEHDGEHFLWKNSETKKWEFVAVAASENEGDVPDLGLNEAPADKVLSLDEQPNKMDVDVDEATGAEDAKEAEPPAPPKTTPSDKGMALLTPAALLAGVSNTPQDRPAMGAAVANGEATKSPLAFPLVSVMAPTAASTKGMDGLLANTFPSQQPEEPSTRAPLPPPPGFSVQNLPGQQPQVPHPFPGAGNTGISLAALAAPVPAPQSHPNMAPAPPPGMMPQASPSGYPAPGSFQTLNPFVQAPLPPLGNNFMFPKSPSDGMMNVSSHGSNLNLQQHVSNKGGLDPTLDFLLSGNNPTQAPGPFLGSSNSLNLLAPPAMTAAQPEPQDPSESIMKFLFDPGNDAPSRSGRPLYADRGGLSESQHRGMPQTKNPFAT